MKRSRNHGSMPVTSATVATGVPARRAARTEKIRSGRGTRIASGLGGAGGEAEGASIQPVRPVSRERRALPNDSANVRPRAITSPTDFIWTPSVVSAPGNFSNVKRGIFTTT